MPILKTKFFNKKELQNIHQKHFKVAKIESSELVFNIDSHLKSQDQAF